MNTTLLSILSLVLGGFAAYQIHEMQMKMKRLQADFNAVIEALESLVTSVKNK
jgi:hypothetical protein